jgi:hypothetical protein
VNRKAGTASNIPCRPQRLGTAPVSSITRMLTRNGDLGSLLLEVPPRQVDEKT